MAKKVLINNEEYSYDFKINGACIDITIDGTTHSFDKSELDINNDGVHYVLDNKDFFVEKLTGRKRKTVDEGSSLSPMPGKILKILVASGETVTKGQPLIIMEAMKMEHTLKASKDGVVKDVKFKEGDLVEGQVELVELES